jgi:hypothetical protein
MIRKRLNKAAKEAKIFASKLSSTSRFAQDSFCSIAGSLILLPAPEGEFCDTGFVEFSQDFNDSIVLRFSGLGEWEDETCSMAFRTMKWMGFQSQRARRAASNKAGCGVS